LISRTRLGIALLLLSAACGGNLSGGTPLDAGADASQTGSGGSSGTSSATTIVSTTSGSITTTGTGGAGGSRVDWGACVGPGECTPEYKGCCEACGVPDIHDYVGVNAKYLSQFRQEVCPVQPPCVPCVPAPRPFFAARCMAGRCEAIDIRQVPELSKCANDTECRLRKGLDCCECGASGAFTSVSIYGQMALGALVCPPMTGCAECAPTPPANLKAVCLMNHCDLAMGL
jgi:hypothetical protein